MKRIKHGFLFLGMVLVLVSFVLSGPSVRCEVKPFKIEQHKECPLCGMFPARYPTFQCQMVFKDGSYEAFDSPAGLMVYLLFADKTGIPSRQPVNVFFRDYVTGNWIESEKTFFVVGAGVMGPMGIDFLPVADKQRAKRLKKEEQGQQVVPYHSVDRSFMTKAAHSGWLHFLARKIVLR